ncbi:hypothetical protein ACIRQF_31350 [Streptomyces sp. NPDC101191]|uniref:hypothetical protein n=1 Tax=Streptomyces sp. NPDC101191 TaxID=3366126 RepID=UPI0037F86274
MDLESALLEALNREIAVYDVSEELPGQRAEADHDIAVYTAAVVALIVRRHDKGAACLVIDEGMDPDERVADAVLSAEGAERDLTEDESDNLGVLTGNFSDRNSAAWHPLCRHVDDRHGVFHLDLDKASKAGLDLLARRAASAK